MPPLSTSEVNFVILKLNNQKLSENFLSIVAWRLGSRQPFGYGLIGPLYHRGKVLIMCADTFGLMADSFV